jgi:hypothetical protein
LQKTFHYDSSYWTDLKSYGIPEGKTGLDELETKLPSYWATAFTKICLGMKIGVETRFYLLNKEAKPKSGAPDYNKLTLKGEKSICFSWARNSTTDRL